MRHLRRITNHLAELRPLSEWAVRVARELGGSEHTCQELDLCLNEAVSNVIRHGYLDEASHQIGVELSREPDALVMRIEDDARPFDPLAVPLPAPTSLEKARPAGRGITLMRTGADSASYERRDAHNVLTLRFVVRD
jgi:anti-sigma regulatory factor (Ser/Thr protein kinase)